VICSFGLYIRKTIVVDREAFLKYARNLEDHIAAISLQLDTITASTRDIIHYLKDLYIQYVGMYIVSREHIFLLCKELHFVTSEHVESFKHTYIDYHRTYYVKLQHFCSSLAKRVPYCSEVAPNLTLVRSMPASCALSQRNTHGATPRTVTEQSQRSQLHDMIRSASLSDKDIANVVNCSTRTVRSARANHLIFGNVSAPNNVRGRRPSIPSHVLNALLDHLLTKPDLYLDEMADFVWDQYELVISVASVRRSLKAYS
jgi:hypothetical protein